MDNVYNLTKLENCNIIELVSSLSTDAVTAGKKFEEVGIKLTKYTNENGDYHILKYIKSELTEDNTDSLGLFRSVILKGSKVVGFSPPKSVSMDVFSSKNTDPLKNRHNCFAEDFIEGTMINVFFDESKGDWEVCTKSNIGARCVFFRDENQDSENTFRYMFLDAATSLDLDFDKLSKEYSYSFVMQHPNNRIVTQFTEKKIFLVGCYKINNEDLTVTEVPRMHQMDILHGSGILFPRRLYFENYDKLRELWAGANTDYTTMGVIVKNDLTGVRSKIRNPQYETVRRLRGNQPKLQYHFLELRKAGNVFKYLEFFNQSAQQFDIFRDQVDQFTKQLHTNYIMCYIKKTKPLKEYPAQYRTHMFLLHRIYVESLRDENKHISKARVIEYVDELPPAKLMFSINYPKRNIDKKEKV